MRLYMWQVMCSSDDESDSGADESTSESDCSTQEPGLVFSQEGVMCSDQGGAEDLKREGWLKWVESLTTPSQPAGGPSAGPVLWVDTEQADLAKVCLLPVSQPSSSRSIRAARDEGEWIYFR